jgi:NADPH:quinone reductase-like Zn-dependent oxidoreductase
LVAVRAAAITPAEFTWPATWADAARKSRLPTIPSHEIAGVGATMGPAVSSIAAGQDVYGLIDCHRDGGAAEFVVARAEQLAAKPHTVDYIHAAAIPLSALTAWQAFRTCFALGAGQTVLIHGGAGGVGSFARCS